MTNDWSYEREAAEWKEWLADLDVRLQQQLTVPQAQLYQQIQEQGEAASYLLGTPGQWLQTKGKPLRTQDQAHKVHCIHPPGKCVVCDEKRGAAQRKDIEAELKDRFEGLSEDEDHLVPIRGLADRELPKKVQPKNFREDTVMAVSANVVTTKPFDTATTMVSRELDKKLIDRETDRQLAAYDALGEDTYPVFSALRFTLRYQEDGKDYTFLALKVNKKGKDHWHLTDGSSYSWDELKRILVRVNPTPTLELLTPSTLFAEDPAQAKNAS